MANPKQSEPMAPMSKDCPHDGNHSHVCVHHMIHLTCDQCGLIRHMVPLRDAAIEMICIKDDDADVELELRRDFLKRFESIYGFKQSMNLRGWVDALWPGRAVHVFHNDSRLARGHKTLQQIWSDHGC